MTLSIKRGVYMSFFFLFFYSFVVNSLVSKKTAMLSDTLLVKESIKNDFINQKRGIYEWREKKIV